jgi:hypothetical protein
MGGPLGEAREVDAVRDPKFTYPEQAPLAVVCRSCGCELTDENTGCPDCDTCLDHMPGTCPTCLYLRREDQGERLLRLSKEARTW